MTLHAWRMIEPGRPLERTEGPLPEPGPGEVLLEVVACGLCHTDVGFLYGGVRTNAPLPLTLGHEIVGRALSAGPGVESAVGAAYIVPAVLPCGECDLCRRGRGNVCRAQKMPGNDFDGGFASHVVVPLAPLCRVPDDFADLPALGVVADAVATSYQTVERARVDDRRAVVVIGSGGLGTFAIQCAQAKGARVVAVDVDSRRLDVCGAELALDASQLDTKAIRSAVSSFERSEGLAPTGRVILECSGSAAGQETAWSLLGYDATLAVVGFTLDRVPLRLSNLMAFDATAFGNWGCLPEHFPAILDLVRDGAVRLEPYVETYPMSALNDLLRAEHHARRPVLIPDFEPSKETEA